MYAARTYFLDIFANIGWVMNIDHEKDEGS